MRSIINDRIFKQNAQMLIGFFYLRRLALQGFDLHPGAVCQFVQRFLKINPLALHHELENITTLVTLTETPPRPSLRPDNERRRFLIIMEWTKPRVVPARVAQFDTGLGNEVYDIYPGFDFINGGHRGRFSRS